MTAVTFRVDCDISNLHHLQQSMTNNNSYASAWTTFVALASTTVQVKELYRYAVKGLSGDPLDSVTFRSVPDRFPDDRRYALLYKKHHDGWTAGEWRHKDNFLCAFTDPELLVSLESTYEIVAANDGHETRILNIRDRTTGTHLIGPLHMNMERDRLGLAKFLSEFSGKQVVCVEAKDFQFGNTSSGVKQRKDSRTVHIVNQSTVDQLSQRIGSTLRASRFRPNIVLQGPAPWTEFDWIGRRIGNDSGLQLAVISKTVRCNGVSVDPLDPHHMMLDIPQLLIEHFPEHGPFLGVYAAVDAPGSLSLGDQLRVLN